MKRNELFMLTELDDMHYLIPTGQAAADYRKALSLNDTGVFIWQTLETDMPKEHLIRLVLERYAPDKDDAEAMVSDIYSFLAHLSALGLVFDDEEPEGKDFSVNTDLEIAGIKIRIASDEDILFGALIPYRHSFLNRPDIIVRFRIGLPAYTDNGTVLVRNREVTVIDAGGRYILMYPQMERVKEIHIDKTYREVTVFALPPYDDTLKEEVFLSLRTPFLLKALSEGALMLHSSSVLYNEKLILFSAASGVGKSTHAALWNSVYGVPVINGDLNLLKPENGRLMSYGTPWCGTSGISNSGAYPVEAIVFLKRMDRNEYTKLSGPEGVLKLLSRTITPMWTKELSGEVTDICIAIRKTVRLGVLGCTPTPEAAVCAMNALND